MSIGKPFWNSSLFLMHYSLRISGPQETVSLSTPSYRDKAFLLSSSTEPRSRLAHTSECVNHRDKHQTWVCHHKALGTLPGLPLWLLSSEAGVALHLLPGLAQQPSLCPALWSLSQFPFSFYACYLAPLGLLFLSWPVSLFLWPSSFVPCSLSLTLALLSSPGLLFYSYLLN